MGRGLSIKQAGNVWLTSVASIQSYIGSVNVYQLRYEDLVLNTEQELKNLCIFLGIEYEETMLINNQNNDGIPIQNPFHTCNPKRILCLFYTISLD